MRAEFFRVAVRSASPLCRCVGVCSGACWLPMKHFGGGAVPAGKDATAGRVDLYLRVQCVDEGVHPPWKRLCYFILQRFPNPFSRAAVPDTRNFTAPVAGGCYLVYVPGLPVMKMEATVVFGGRAEDSYLVDPASSHMLVSKIKPCMSKYKQSIR